MCRLLAVVSPHDVTVDAVLGADAHAVFQDMALLHRDGWGTAWVDGDDVRTARHDTRPVLHLLRAATSGLGDAALTKTLTEQPAQARLVHLRLASEGMDCATRNTHPFRAGDLAFAHNGALVPEERMDDMIAPDLLASLEGETDSERYFAVLRTAMRQGDGDADEALVAAVRRIRERYPYASMNALLLAPDRLVVVHASRDARVPTEVFEESGLGDRLPAGHDESYYRMHVKRTAEGALAFASSGLDVSDWEELPAETVLVVTLGSLEVREYPIAVTASA